MTRQGGWLKTTEVSNRLDELLEARMDHATADAPWSCIAAVLAINRLRAPGSALAIEEER